MSDFGIEIIGHILIVIFLLSGVVFTLVTYILYKTKVNRGLAAASLLMTLALLIAFLYHAYKLSLFGGFFN